ncbi:hypothetical protein Krac_7932 [Ktedonobacter racemifer DSM 44963]|uniref:Uncharacterized protein n=1 Tax=Ktedonobacter racemifer DSM 44963 TaxID=485913 RepID=D6TLH6_KTERA|nr:hypothetical protein Krac_7932 [Ktedonobacter racemifer DSM 44963]
MTNIEKERVEKRNEIKEMEELPGYQEKCQAAHTSCKQPFTDSICTKAKGHDNDHHCGSCDLSFQAG